MATLETGVAGGVSFALTDEQRELRALAREFAEKEIRPKAAEYDEHQTHPADIIAKAHEVGLMNLHVPESLGGPELPCFDGMLVGEELNWGCSGIGTSIGANGLARRPDPRRRHRRAEEAVARAAARGADPRLLRPHRAGRRLGRLRHPDDGRARGATSTSSTARRCSSPTPATRRGWSCFASTDRSKGHKGLSAFVVPMDTPGVTIEKHLDKMGQRATDTSAVAFQDVVVPAANRLGEEGEGFKIAMQTLDFTRPGTAVGAVGVAQAAFELAVEYAKERVQFGMPIAMNQGVSFLVADMATEIEAARLLTWQAAWMIDQGWGRKATLYSSFAKRFAADTAMKVTTDAVQVFGGYGYMKEYPVEKLMRDAKLFQIYEGTSQIQRLVIAKEIFLGVRDRWTRRSLVHFPLGRGFSLSPGLLLAHRLVPGSRVLR